MWTLQRVFLNNMINKEYSHQDMIRKNQEFREKFLALTSETEENVNCLKHLEYGKLTDSEAERVTSGVKIKGKDILISEIMNAMEDIEYVPEPVKEYYPDLTNEEWQAATRFVTVMLLLISGEVFLF